MDLRIGPRGIIEIDDAAICFRNFEGRGDTYNREGDRNFAVIIPTEEMADALVDEGWNVKVKDPREEGDIPFMYLPVKIKFNDRGPAIYLKSGDSMNKLDEDSVGLLDNIEIMGCDMDIRPYDWVLYEGTPKEKRGRAAYLQSIHITQKVDRFAARYSEE